MSLPRFFLENQVLSAETEAVFPLRLSPDDAKHAKVLRLARGEHVAVIDAASDYFECEIVDFSDSLPMVSVARHEEADAAGPQVMLLQGLAKGDKMETVIRHATEVGVVAFVPVSCKRSVVKLDGKKAAAKTERWRAIAKSAAMQSGQPRIPEVSEPMSVREAAALLVGATAVLVCWEEAPGSARLRDAVQGALAVTRTPAADARIAVVVGPEGGLASEEVDTLLACNPQASLVTLGPSILRTETAGIVAPALVLYELGGMGNTPAHDDASASAFEDGIIEAPLAAASFAGMFADVGADNE
ncbi:RsmE family RNA methyltransferase [Adlercreutzia sp. R21]|uniref:Ribosomal RNA small subunit methyltransferase E n=1 Tax=Adlercreutzia wanghongyangiae TaxID=3111451 RepID=A0ABU6IHK9_9ACTN|nr:RsmE family RNA methyltransferase [Adlercreutzia sp. R21]MEC4175936.1 RsmE family RNA methyltransferase [Adlercreutzia sp. R7]MEC4184080.1 RsmE family RNA methyltransferase [Adlercreutzia sp. R21]